MEVVLRDNNEKFIHFMYKKDFTEEKFKKSYRKLLENT